MSTPAQPGAVQPSTGPGCVPGCMGLIVLVLIIGWIASLFDSPSPGEKLTGSAKAEAHSVCDSNERYADAMGQSFDYKDCLDSWAKAWGYN